MYELLFLIQICFSISLIKDGKTGASRYFYRYFKPEMLAYTHRQYIKDAVFLSK